MMRRLLSLLLVACVSAAHATPSTADEGDQTFHGRNAHDGWFWYQNPPAPPKPAKPLPPPVATAPAVAAPSTNRDLAAFKDFQRRLEESLQMATINPTDANVLSYLQLWRQANQKASDFTDVAQAVAWRTPSVNADFQGVRPTSPAAIQVYDRQREDQQSTTVAKLARTHGMFFFFRSDCPYCHAMAPMLKQFGQRYGMTIYPISMDGGGLPEFANPQRDNGIAQRLITELGIPPEEFQVPFTVLANPSSREVLPVGFGVMTAAEMVERIDMVMQLRTQQTADVVGQRPRSEALGPGGAPALAGATLGRSTPAPLALQ